MSDLATQDVDFDILKKLPPRVSINELSKSMTDNLRNMPVLGQDLESRYSLSFPYQITKQPDHTSSIGNNHNNTQVEAIEKPKYSRPSISQPDSQPVFSEAATSAAAIQTHRQLDLSMRSQIEDMKIAYIEQYMLQEEKLKQELADQIRSHAAIMAARESHWKEIVEEKVKHTEVLIAQHQREINEYKKRLHDKDEFYVGQMSAMEKQYQQQQQELDNRWKDRIKVLQDQINIDKERSALTEKAKIEAKEASLQMTYEKKVKKFTKQLESVMEHYRAKELMIQGALEEARREIINLQANHAALEQVNREELLLKDKRLVEIRQYLDEADSINRRADEWKTLARELSTIVVQACATVEELPDELWTSTTPGLFTSVWDELRGQNGSTTRTGYGKVSVDEHVRSYSEKKRDCVVANRAELAKCLKYSKIIHDRIRVDEMRPISPSSILS